MRNFTTATIVFFSSFTLFATFHYALHLWGKILRIAILGGDGYCGWATALYFSSQGHSVATVDNFARRQWDHELGVETLTPIRPLAERLRVWQELTGHTIELYAGDITDLNFWPG